MAKLLILWALACTLTACTRPAGKPPRGGMPSLVLVTLDTTRADRIGAYGYKGAMTPNLDAFAQKGVFFRYAYAPIPLTTPAHSSMMTGLYPTRHGLLNNGDAVLGEQFVTLAEILKEKGYKTGASVAAFVTTRVWNLDQGFDAYFDQVKSSERSPFNRWKQERPAGDVTDDALEFLASVGEAPFFLWAHYYDPHDPYKPPSPFAQVFANQPYNGEIAYMDQEIGRLKEAVDKHANPAGTVWILVGDHGEAVEGEHGEHTHGVFIFDPTMRVPFIVSAPAVKHPGREIIDVTVSNTDVMPTALGLLGIDIPKDLDGVDLSGAVQGRKISRPPVFMAAWDVAQRFGYHPEYGAVDGTLKLIDTPKPLLFDVAKDPRESRNLLDEAPEARARLSKVVKETLDRMELGASSSASPDVAQQLVALGYVESTYSLKEHSDIDAKDKTDVILRLERIRAMARSNSPARDVEIAYRELIEKEPTFLEARIGLAHALEQQRKFDEALTVYERALERHGGSTVLRSSYSSCLGMARRFEEAIAETRKVLEQVPNDGLARSALLRLLSDAGRPAEAIAQAKAWLEENPEDRQVQAQLGIEYARARDYEVAEPLLRKSLADGEPRLFVRRFLGQITLNRGDFAEAVQHFQAELEWFPVRMETHIELAGAWLLMEKWEEAASEYRFVAEYDPRSYRARLLWAQAVFNGGDYKLADEVLAPALRAAPEDPDVLLLQANILAKLGRRDEGKALFDKARTFDQKRKQAMKDDLSTFTPASRP